VKAPNSLSAYSIPAKRWACSSTRNFAPKSPPASSSQRRTSRTVACRIDLASGGAQERGDEHGHAALHVDRTATPDVAVDDIAAERRPLPVLPRSGDDVDVPLEEQRSPVPLAGQARDEVGPPRLARVDLGLDARVLEQAADELHALRLVPGRVRGVESDQPPEQLDGGHGRAKVRRA